MGHSLARVPASAGAVSSAILVAASLVAAGGCSSKSSPKASSNDASDETVPLVDSALDASPDVSVLVYDAGLACPALPMTAPGADCDTCIEQSCDMPWCRCTQDMDVEAGMTGCPGYLACTSSCVADGGDASACETTACMSGGITSADAQKGEALLSCIQKSCASQCPGFVAPYF
jgi:hypothetical protein